MSVRRLLVLLAGPPVLVGGIYLLTTPEWNGRPAAAHATEHVAFETVTLREKSWISACEEAAKRATSLLDEPSTMLVRPPYVLVGNVEREELVRRYEEVVIPLERALSASYFDRPPDRPITMLLLKDEDSFRRHAARIDGTHRSCYAGYYLQAENRMVLDLGTGDGTLAHELTHALAEFDFPELPEWFDEGLASLHEESVFSPDGLRVRGLSNWRIRDLRRGYRESRVRSLESLVNEGRLRSDQEGIDYAHARYFCLYLQERKLLAPFYRKFRTTHALDPTGARALRELLGIDSLDEIETEFRRWVQDQAERHESA